MRGLKTQEGNKFINFFRLVQREAAKAGAVFFLDCGEGNEFSGKDIEGEDLRGWLITNAEADQFEAEWEKGSPGDKWENRITWAEWSGNTRQPTIKFVQY